MQRHLVLLRVPFYSFIPVPSVRPVHTCSWTDFTNIDCFTSWEPLSKAARTLRGHTQADTAPPKIMPTGSMNVSRCTGFHKQLKCLWELHICNESAKLSSQSAGVEMKYSIADMQRSMKLEMFSESTVRSTDTFHHLSFNQRNSFQLYGRRRERTNPNRGHTWELRCENASQSPLCKAL